MKKKYKERQILFTYWSQNGRSSADCGDIYNWLLDINQEIAEGFKKKWQGAKEISIKELKERWQKAFGEVTEEELITP